jgi:hypothetical protein
LATVGAQEAKPTNTRKSEKIFKRKTLLLSKYWCITSSRKQLKRSSLS